MRAVFSFFSMLALGLMIAAIIIVSMSGAPNTQPHLQMPGISGGYLDYMSVIIGLGVGLAIAIIAQVPWSQLPHRLVSFILDHAGMLKLVALGALAAAVLIYL
jgi:hypothetical protein